MTLLFYYGQAFAGKFVLYQAAVALKGLVGDGKCVEQVALRETV